MEPELKHVVIISLPPPDDPSKGKTITAFTVTNPSSLQQPQPETLTPHPNHQYNPPPPPPPSSRRPSALSFLPSRRALAVVVGFTLLISSVWACLFSEAPIQLLEDSNSEGKRELSSILLPLYPKSKGSAADQNRTSVSAFGDVKLVSSSKAVDGVRSVDSSAVLPLRGNIFPDGQYYTKIFIGNPPRPYFLDVDTGSDLTWIQCDAPCTSCAKGPHPLYKPTKANIVSPRDSLCLEVQSNMNNRHCDSCQQCDYEIEYADHSSSLGALARDQMQLILTNKDRAKFDFIFGCAYDQQGQLSASPAKTDGILGLSSAKVSLTSQLASQGVTNDVVGHCISSEADGGGYMFFGDEFVPRWGMTWVPTVDIHMNFYQAEIRKISYGAQQISTGRRGESMRQVVLDTGSSYTYFPGEEYANLIASLESISGNLVRDNSDQTLPVCWQIDYPVRSVADVKQSFLPLTLQFGNRWFILPTTFTIPPEGYLVISNKGNVCLGVLNGTEVHDGSSIILGDISLKGKLIVYDNVQQKIGWVQSACNKPHSRPADFPFFF